MNRKIILFGVLGIALGLLVWRYKDRLGTYAEDPKQLLDTILAAGGFLNTTLKLIALNVGIAFSCLLLEWLIVGWEKSAMRRLIIRPKKSAMGDTMCWLLTVVGLYDFLVFISTLGLFYVLNGLIQSKFYLGLGAYLGNEIVVFTIIFILSDFKHFLWHFTMHRLSPLWEVHKYHHSATSMNLITTARGHFLGKAVLTVFDAFFFALVGAPPEVFVGIFIVREIWGMWLHADVKFPLGFAGRYIFVTPQAHKIHHSTDVRHFDRNFGTLFVWWDRMFGTYYEPEEVTEIGVEDDPYNQKGFWYDMVLGFRLFLKKLIPG